MTTPNSDDEKLIKSPENQEELLISEDVSPKVDNSENPPEEAKPPKQPFFKVLKCRLRKIIKSRRFKKILLISFLTLTVLLILGYLWLCLLTEKELKQNAISAIESMKKQGFEITYESIESAYYPISSGIYINNLSITSPDFLGRWKWEMGKVSVSTFPFASNNILINAKGMHKIYFSGENHSLQFATKDLALQMISSVAGGFESFAGKLDYSLALAPQNIRSSALASVSFAVSRKDRNSYDFKFILDDLQFPNEQKRLISVDEVTLSGYINSLTLQNTIADTILDWQKSDGSITLRKIRIDWDSFQMQGEANLTLDARMQPVLAGIARMKGFLNLVRMLEDYGLTSKKEGNIIKIVYDETGKDTPEKVFRTLFSIQKNKLYIGYLPLFKTPLLPLKDIAVDLDDEQEEEKGEGSEESLPL